MAYMWVAFPCKDHANIATRFRGWFFCCYLGKYSPFIFRMIFLFRSWLSWEETELCLNGVPVFADSSIICFF